MHHPMPSPLRLIAAHFSWFGLMMQPSYEWRPTWHSFPTRWLSCTKTRGVSRLSSWITPWILTGWIDIGEEDGTGARDSGESHWYDWMAQLAKLGKGLGEVVKVGKVIVLRCVPGWGGGWGRAKKTLAKNDQKFRVRKHIRNHSHKQLNLKFVHSHGRPYHAAWYWGNSI